MIQLDLVSVGVVQDSGDVVMVLRAPDAGKLLIVDIESFTGRAIHMAAEGIEAPRPLTHDLLYNTLNVLGASLTAIEIRELRERIFYATLILTVDGRRVEVDARPSDAVALALRAHAPVLVSEAVLDAAGIDEEDGDDEDAGDDEDDDTSENPTVH